MRTHQKNICIAFYKPVWHLHTRCSWNWRCQPLVSITAVHAASKGQSGISCGSKVFPRALKTLAEKPRQDVSSHKWHYTEITQLLMLGKEMGGSISLIWLQTARVDQKAPKVLLFYQRSKNWNRIRLILVFWLVADSFKKNISKVSTQYCTNIATSVFFICLIFTVNYFTFFICLWCSMMGNCRVFPIVVETHGWSWTRVGKDCLLYLSLQQQNKWRVLDFFFFIQQNVKKKKNHATVNRKWHQVSCATSAGVGLNCTKENSDHFRLKTFRLSLP